MYTLILHFTILMIVLNWSLKDLSGDYMRFPYIPDVQRPRAWKVNLSVQFANPASTSNARSLHAQWTEEYLTLGTFVLQWGWYLLDAVLTDSTRSTTTRRTLIRYGVSHNEVEHSPTQSHGLASLLIVQMNSITTYVRGCYEDLGFFRDIATPQNSFLYTLGLEGIILNYHCFIQLRLLIFTKDGWYLLLPCVKIGCRAQLSEIFILGCYILLMTSRGTRYSTDRTNEGDSHRPLRNHL